MTNEECTEILYDIQTDAVYGLLIEEKEAIDKAIEAVKSQPCEDCISREAVKEMLVKEWTNYVPMELDINLSFVLEKISVLPSVTPQQTGWIPCNEKLPEEYGEYICTMSIGNVQECGFVPSGELNFIPGWSTCEADGFKKLNYQDVIAWMPLPEPYKESEDKE